MAGILIYSILIWRADAIDENWSDNLARARISRDLCTITVQILAGREYELINIILDIQIKHTFTEQRP